MLTKLSINYKILKQNTTLCPDSFDQMIDSSLKSHLWVQAQIRICDINCLSAVVIRRGDDDAGAVIIKIDKLANKINIFHQVRTSNGSRAWMSVRDKSDFTEEDAANYISNCCKLDPDIWVLEIVDPRGLYEFDGEVL